MIALKTLIVDDSLLASRKLSAMLEEMGHQVVKMAATGAEALVAYREVVPDLVTMDITMPDMDGIQATAAIIAEFPNANIIMVTSHGQEGMVRDALRAGAKGYVLKPVKVDRLRDMIKKIVEMA